MHFSLYNDFGALNSSDVFAAVSQGLELHGHKVSRHNDHADVAVIWSQLWAGRMRPNQDVWQRFTSSGRAVMIVEVGALKRNHTWKIGINGNYNIFGYGHNSARAEQLGLELTPWQESGEHVVIACQRGDSNQWTSMPSVEQWTQDTVDMLKRYTSRPIVIRTHPRYRVNLPRVQIPNKLPGTYDNFDFDQCLVNAWAVVNWNSNPGVDAVLRGIPAFVDESSLAASVGNLDLSQIEKPLRPDRQQWLNDLAYTEWTTSEIAQGLPFELLHNAFDRG
jgi:hypothetical protein